MNKYSYMLVAVLAVVIVGAGAYVYSRNTQEPTVTTPDQTMESDDQPTKDSSIPTKQPGSYEDYSSNKVAATTGTKLLFFHAPWCPQCRQLDASIKSSTLPSNTTIFKVDYDSNNDLRQKYDVTIQTTIVKIDDDGEKIDSYVAYDEPTFANVKYELLP